MERQIERSRAPKRVPGFTSWSADYAQAVSTALRRWTEYAATAGLPPVPNGLVLDRYGAFLTDGTEQRKPVSLRTAADYLSRIDAGLAIVEPDSVSTARAYVARDWRERADLVGAPTKTGSQMVGASSIYDLRFQLMDEARSRAMRGLDAAKTYRNGLILSVGIALPQRARALSALTFDSSLRLTGGDAIHVRIPAAMLKLREDQKQGEPFDTVFHNDLLADALREYRHDFRPVFDDAPALFPSVLGRGHALSERRIGTLAGNMTNAAFSVRISIHRLRDNVATEASEELDAGARAATVMLGHRDQAVTASPRGPRPRASTPTSSMRAGRRRHSSSSEGAWWRPACRCPPPRFPQFPYRVETGWAPSARDDPRPLSTFSAHRFNFRQLPAPKHAGFNLVSLDRIGARLSWRSRARPAPRGEGRVRRETL